MKHNLDNLLSFLSKQNYSRNELFLIIIIVVFLVICTNTIIDSFCVYDSKSIHLIMNKIIYNWIFSLNCICVIYYSKYIYNNEINTISNKLNCIEKLINNKEYNNGN